MSRFLMRLGCRGITLALCTGLIFAEGRLVGYVKLNHPGGPPVEGVTISSHGANEQRSDTTGKYSLLFATRSPGERVEVVPAKQGHLVVNWFQMKLALPAQPDIPDSFLNIIVCREAEYEQWIRNFVGVKARANIEQRYQEQLRRIKEKYEHDQARQTAEFEKAKVEHTRLLARVDDLERQLAAVKPGDASDRYQEALQLFLAGDLEGAHAALPKDEILREISAHRESLRQGIDSLQLKAAVYESQFDFDNAEALYREAAHADPTYFQGQIQLADFLQGQGRFGESRTVYSTALSASRTREERARALNNLGLLQRATNELEGAEISYREALENYRRLAEQNPAAYLPNVAGTLNNLGLLQHATNELEGAEASYREALEIRRGLAEQNPAAYLPDVATTLNNLGVLQSDANELEGAEASYREALEIRRGLAELHSAFEIDVAVTLVSLGWLHSDWTNELEDAGQRDQAREYLLEAAQVLRGLNSARAEQLLTLTEELLERLNGNE